MSQNYIGKKPDTFHVGWGNKEDQSGASSKGSHPGKPKDSFTVGWGQQ